MDFEDEAAYSGEEMSDEECLSDDAGIDMENTTSNGDRDEIPRDYQVNLLYFFIILF